MKKERAEEIKNYGKYIREKGNAKDTADKRMSQAEKYLKWLETNGLEIYTSGEKEIKGYLNELGEKYNGVTVKFKRYMVKYFYGYLKESGVIEVDPFEKMDRRERRKKEIGEEEERELERYLSHLRKQGAGKEELNHSEYALREYFGMLEESGAGYLEVKLSTADNYRMGLCTMRKESGEVKYSASTIRGRMKAVEKFYGHLLKRGKVIRNVFKETGRVKTVNALPRNILDEDAMMKLLEGLKRKIKEGKDICERRMYYRVHVMAEIMYSSGARINEILKIQEKEVDFERGTLKLKDDKTGKSRTGFLNGYAKELLRKYMKERKYMMVGKSRSECVFFGDAAASKAFNRFVRKVSEELGLGEFTSHNMRHGFGYHMLRAGCDIRYIQEFLGHDRLGTTQVYTKVEKADLRGVLDKYHPRSAKREEKCDLPC